MLAEFWIMIGCKTWRPSLFICYFLFSRSSSPYRPKCFWSSDFCMICLLGALSSLSVPSILKLSYFYYKNWSHTKETVAHKWKCFELYMLLNREPMKWLLDKARSMIKLWNAAYATGNSIDYRVTPKSFGGRKTNVKAPPLFSCQISISNKYVLRVLNSNLRHSE